MSIAVKCSILGEGPSGTGCQGVAKSLFLYRRWFVHMGVCTHVCAATREEGRQCLRGFAVTRGGQSSHDLSICQNPPHSWAGNEYVRDIGQMSCSPGWCWLYFPQKWHILGMGLTKPSPGLWQCVSCPVGHMFCHLSHASLHTTVWLPNFS